MNLKDILAVLNYIYNAINENQLIGKYQELVGLLNQAQSSSSDDLSAQIEAKKTQIQEIQKKVDPTQWDFFRKKLLSSFGADVILGNVAIDEMDSIFSHNQANPGGAAKELNQFIDKISNINQNIQNLKNGFSSFGSVPDDRSLADDEVVIELIFDHQVAVNTLEELEDSSGDWNLVLKSFAELVGEPPESAQIYSVSKTNPFGLVLIAKKAVANLILDTVKKILENSEKVLVLAEHLQKIEALKLQNKSARVKVDLEETMAELQKDLISTLVRQYKKAIKDGKNDPTVDDRFEHAVSIVAKHIKGGGIVDLSEDSSVENSLTQMKLAESYQKIRQLESSLENNRLLESPQEQTDEDGHENIEDVDSGEPSLEV